MSGVDAERSARSRSGSALAHSARGRCFAAAYDAVFAAAERSGLSDHRRTLLAGAAGRTVELGAGTGLNVPHYPDTVSSLLLTEPDPNMVRRLAGQVSRSPARITVARAPAAAIPAGDGSVDTVVSTLVLCTVPDPIAALNEVSRVLAPGGRLLFLEHVRSQRPLLATWQDRLARPWSWCACGCRCNRATLGIIESSPLQLQAVEHGRLRGLGPLLSPLIIGSAVRPTD